MIYFCLICFNYFYNINLFLLYMAHLNQEKHCCIGSIICHDCFSETSSVNLFYDSSQTTVRRGCEIEPSLRCKIHQPSINDAAEKLFKDMRRSFALISKSFLLHNCSRQWTGKSSQAAFKIPLLYSSGISSQIVFIIFFPIYFFFIAQLSVKPSGASVEEFTRSHLYRSANLMM